MYDKTIHDGTFTFVIFDEYGDGLCCTQGNGGYTIFYGLENFPGTLLYPKDSDSYMFGSANKCAVRWLCCRLHFTRLCLTDVSCLNLFQTVSPTNTVSYKDKDFIAVYAFGAYEFMHVPKSRHINLQG